MCESHKEQQSVVLYLQRKGFEAFTARARAIRFARAKPRNRREYYWAKVVTYAEAYGNNGPFITGGFHKHG